MQTNIDQNEVKNLWKITYFLKKKFRAGPSPAHVAGLDPVGFLPTSMREQFTHACYSRDVINLPVHSVCAFSAKLEKFTWKQDEGNNSFGPLSSPFRLFFFWFLWFFMFFSVSVFRSSCGSFPFIFVFSFLPVFFVFFSFPSPFLFLSSLSSASLRSPSVYLSFCSFQKISHPLFLSPYAAQFSFLLVLFLCFLPAPFFSPSSAQSSSAAFIGQRRLCAGNGWLGNGLKRDDSRDTCPIIEENWHCCCKKTSLGLYC